MNNPSDQLSLNQVKGFLLDMDGTIYLGEEPLPGSLDFINYLLAKGIPFYFITNNSSKSAHDYLQKLNRLGFPIDQDQVLTSGQVTASALSCRYPGASIYLVGTPSLQLEFESAGFTHVVDQVDLVVVGFDTGITYEKLSHLCTFVRRGLPYFATHPDFNCPTQEGPIPDIGATLAYVEAATGRWPDEIFGKPFPGMVDEISSMIGLKVSDLCMVGDRLYTDIAMGRHGLQTILVLSGETKEADLKDSSEQPDWIFNDLGELLSEIKHAHV